MDMKKKRIAQWIVFGVAVLVVLVGVPLAFWLWLSSMGPITGVVALYMMIVSAGVGVLTGYGMIIVWVRLAERGWFL